MINTEDLEAILTKAVVHAIDQRRDMIGELLLETVEDAGLTRAMNTNKK